MSLRLLRHKPMFSNNDRYFAMANDFWFKLDDSMVDLPVSPHYWNPKTLSVTLLEGVKIVDGVSRGVYNGEIELNMSPLTKSNTYNRCFRMVSER